MKDIISAMAMAGFGRITSRNRAVMERALTAIEGGNDWEFDVGETVEKYTGEAVWHGIVVSRYLTTKGKRRYVVEVQPQGFQMIAVPDQLRLIAKNGPAITSDPSDETLELQRRTKEIITRLRFPIKPRK